MTDGRISDTGEEHTVDTHDADCEQRIPDIFCACSYRASIVALERENSDLRQRDCQTQGCTVHEDYARLKTERDTLQRERGMMLDIIDNFAADCDCAKAYGDCDVPAHIAHAVRIAISQAPTPGEPSS
jgi:hypothetical protein